MGGVSLMTPKEAAALGRLTGRVLADTVARVEEVHRAVARRALGLTPATSSARTVHDAIAGGFYGGVRAALRVAGSAAGGAVELVPRPSAAPAGSTPRARTALAALNASIGDQLVIDNSALAIRMALRADGREVLAQSDTLAATYPDATTKLAVFLHGLGETEDAWGLHADRHYQDGTVTYGTRLADDLGYTPLYLRYNTGLHVSDNGRRLADLLTDIVAAWPTTIDEIVVVAHSVGGLVTRSACYYGEQTAEPWVPLVRHIFYLGSPHLGAPLERLASYVGWALSKTDETRPVASLMNGRSAGFKDLRFGYLLDDDWRDCDTDTCLRDHRHDVPLLPTANHYAVSATLTADRDHPLGRIVGDLLVQPASAHGRHPRGRHIPFEVDHRHHLGRSHHFHLLNHPALYEVMRARLQTVLQPVLQPAFQP